MRARLLALGIAAALLAGCADPDIVLETAFPPSVPGLAADQPWVMLPVGAWVTEGEVRPVAIAACVSPLCAPRAAIGLFQARGRNAADALAVARDPERLAALLAGPRQRARSQGSKRSAPPTPTVAAAEPLGIPGRTGFVLRLSRADGSRAAYGAVLAGDDAGTATLLLVVTTSGDAARRIARDVAGALG